jgi:hypothetical protein
MPKSDRTPAQPPSPELLLAAIDRAERHKRRPDLPGVLLFDITMHLGLRTGSWTTRRLRPTLQSLEDACDIERLRRKGMSKWSLTATGAKRLAAMKRKAAVPVLPEAPQHRAWRQAHVAAGERITDIRGDLGRLLAEAQTLVDTDEATSDGWFELSERLRQASWRLGSATYCLREWPEPNDAQADREIEKHHGRRNVRLWDQPV